ncbi:MAG: hypothetical protein R6X08_11815 [Desulfosalsimonadaceae bacterium]
MNETAVSIASEGLALEGRLASGAALHVTEGADHFLFGFFDDLAAALSRYIPDP